MTKKVYIRVVHKTFDEHLVPLYTCDNCGEHIEAGEVMYTDGHTVLCEECANDTDC